MKHNIGTRQRGIGGVKKAFGEGILRKTLIILLMLSGTCLASETNYSSINWVDPSFMKDAIFFEIKSPHPKIDNAETIKNSPDSKSIIIQKINTPIKIYCPKGYSLSGLIENISHTQYDLYDKGYFECSKIVKE